MENEKLFELMEKMYFDFKGSQEKLFSEIQEIKNDVITNSEKVDNVEKIVLRMEQNYGNKLEALFDGYKQNTEQLNNIEMEVSKHEEVILRRIK